MGSAARLRRRPGGHAPEFTGCRVLVTHRAVVENDQDGTEIAVCDPVRWSTVWPRLCRFDN